MIGFIETSYSGGSVRVNDIVRVSDPKANPHGAKVQIAYLRDGKSFEVFAHHYDALMARPVQIIPALAGISVIWTWFMDGEEGLERSPVIAWGLCLDGEMRPITPRGVNDAQHRETYVEMPDGRIHGVGEYVEPLWFDNADLMMEHFRGLEEKRRGGA